MRSKGWRRECNNASKIGEKVYGGGPQNLDSVLSSDLDPAKRISDEQETQKAHCPIQG